MPIVLVDEYIVLRTLCRGAGCLKGLHFHDSVDVLASPQTGDER